MCHGSEFTDMNATDDIDIAISSVRLSVGDTPVLCQNGSTLYGANPARGCCVPTPTQRAIPPGSTGKSRGSKLAYHAMHYSHVRPVSVVLQLRLVSG